MEKIFVRFKTFIEENKLILPGEKLILGVSGGPDSLFLFHMALMLKNHQKNEFIVAHFNHLLRKEASREEEYVRSVCQKNNIALVSEKKDVRKLFKGDSLEQTARNLRYDFFLKTSRTYKIKKVVLAHHKDDLIETVLLRMLRGSGLSGLRGILPISKYKKIVVVRPLLFLEKKEITAFLTAREIKYLVDKSNFQEEFLRNKIRLRLLPVLSKISNSYKDNLYNLAKSIGWDYDFIHKQSLLAVQSAVLKESANIFEISFEKIAHLHRSLLNGSIRICLEWTKGNLRRVDSKHIDEIIDLIFERPVGSVVDIPDLKITKKEKSLVFRKIEANSGHKTI
ncbi:MAG: tRNA lysidine(34) synthetase TilS [Candidatus Omnitrophica bacterium]|nr:tRNA lysidine(34) synthetase TilS [Candidatus Omnitrophota bacterium]